jgi:hypothetical protein
MAQREVGLAGDALDKGYTLGFARCRGCSAGWKLKGKGSIAGSHRAGGRRSPRTD